MKFNKLLLIMGLSLLSLNSFAGNDGKYTANKDYNMVVCSKPAANVADAVADLNEQIPGNSTWGAKYYLSSPVFVKEGSSGNETVTACASYMSRFG